MTKELANSGLVSPAESLPDIHTDRVQDSWMRHSRILSLRNNIGLNFIRLGHELYDFEERKLYIEQGCDTFEDYIAQLGLARSTVFAWKSIYKVFVIKFQVPEITLSHIPWSKLEKIRG